MALPFAARLLPGLAALISAAALLPAPAKAQQSDRFPSSTVTIVVPFQAGGANDFVARTVAQPLSDTWKVPVVVENRVGAAGNIAADFVARAPASGHTILLGAVSMVTNPPLYKIQPYLPRVLTPVGVGVTGHLVTIARADFPARDIPGMLALSASKAGGLNAASAGAGTLSHLGLELLASSHKAKLNHIPYKGSAPALNDVMGAQVDVMIDTIVTAAPLIAAGKVKALAVHSPRRSPVLPGVPTYEEQGVKGMSFSAWNMFVVPTATPADRVAALNAALAKVMREPAIAKALADRGLDVIVQTPAESLEFMRNDAQRWEKVIKDKNISM
ncbi:MAG TPA: tripartite tricarboxylate transporter substrate binding protein [Ramlibacter sp.]|nr:tripartite tricarboxylate transporter substrate binding protein [Ramlibacter sp.]